LTLYTSVQNRCWISKITDVKSVFSSSEKHKLTNPSLEISWCQIDCRIDTHGELKNKKWLISCLARDLDIDVLPNSSVALSALKLRLAMNARLAQLMSWAQLSLLALHDLASFQPEITQILSLNSMEIF